VFRIIACCIELDGLFASRCLVGMLVGLLCPWVPGADVTQYSTRVAGIGTDLLFSGGYGFMKPIPVGFVPVVIPNRRPCSQC
jgi:hypothetical protein